MLGVPSPKVSIDAVSGTVIKFWDTLKELDQTSGATLAVSVGVIATLVVFERWIPAIPGGLVAVVGAIAVSWGFDLESHGVSTLGHVPSGLPHVGFPAGVGWHDAAAAHSLRVDVPGDHRAERRDLQGLRRPLPGAIRRERRPGRHRRREPGGRASAARSSSTAARRRPRWSIRRRAARRSRS